jgi:uncharacterized repeat protein (TIGR03803 family)
LTVANGALYGTTYFGGGPGCGYGCGTVFKITTSGTESVIYSFKGYPEDGAVPYAGLIAAKGTLYGTTFFGGDYSCGSGSLPSGCGTVYEITKSGSESVLYSFKGGTDGLWPQARLLNVKGMLYGTTLQGGGTSNSGTVFAVTTSGTETVLHRFKRAKDGAYPAAGLTNVYGALYGTTLDGGQSNLGTVFTITTSGAESVLHSFKGGTDGSIPAAGLLNVNGVLYGTTGDGGSARCSSNGCGTVFKITTSGLESVLYAFKGRKGGDLPQSSLTNVSGRLYGTTVGGGGMGCTGGCGTVYGISP